MTLLNLRSLLFILSIEISYAEIIFNGEDYVLGCSVTVTPPVTNSSPYTRSWVGEKLTKWFEAKFSNPTGSNSANTKFASTDDVYRTFWNYHESLPYLTPEEIVKVLSSKNQSENVKLNFDLFAQSIKFYNTQYYNYTNSSNEIINWSTLTGDYADLIFIDLAKMYNSKYQLGFTQEHLKILNFARMMKSRFNYFNNYLFLFTLINFESYGLQFFSGLASILKLPNRQSKQLLDQFPDKLNRASPRNFFILNSEFNENANPPTPYFLPVLKDPTPQQIADLNAKALSFLIAAETDDLIIFYERQIRTNKELVRGLQEMRDTENKKIDKADENNSEAQRTSALINYNFYDAEIKKIRQENELLSLEIKKLE
ncbi:MAG: hypothetical protein QE271_06050 [Bacteriovoracaceae bacterium]|nr:hypothetical protein [Bacteriovoracaceae bacterium]